MSSTALHGNNVEGGAGKPPEEADGWSSLRAPAAAVLAGAMILGCEQSAGTSPAAATSQPTMPTWLGQHDAIGADSRRQFEEVVLDFGPQHVTAELLCSNLSRSVGKVTGAEQLAVEINGTYRVVTEKAIQAIVAEYAEDFGSLGRLASDNGMQWMFATDFFADEVDKILLQQPKIPAEDVTHLEGTDLGNTPQRFMLLLGQLHRYHHVRSTDYPRRDGAHQEMAGTLVLPPFTPSDRGEEVPFSALIVGDDEVLLTVGETAEGNLPRQYRLSSEVITQVEQALKEWALLEYYRPEGDEIDAQLFSQTHAKRRMVMDTLLSADHQIE